MAIWNKCFHSQGGWWCFRCSLSLWNDRFILIQCPLVLPLGLCSSGFEVLGWMQLIVETERNCWQPREIASLYWASSLQLSPDWSLWADDKWLWESSAVGRWSRLDLTFLLCALKQFAVSPYCTASHVSFLSRLVMISMMDGVKLQSCFLGFMCWQIQASPFCFYIRKERGCIWNSAWIPPKIMLYPVCFSFTWWLQTEPRGRDGGSGRARSAGVPTTSRAPWAHNLLEEGWRQPGWQRWTDYSKRWLWLTQHIYTRSEWIGNSFLPILLISLHNLPYGLSG